MAEWHTLSIDETPDPARSDAEVVYALGSAYERGLAHGSHGAAKIAENLEIVDGLITEHGGAKFAAAFDELVAANRPYAEGQDPELADQVRGIAEGAGLEERLVWRLNLPAHFVMARLHQECSQILVGAGASGSGHPLLAKTRDFRSSSVFRQLVTVQEDQHGFRLIEGNTAGSVTWPGSGLSSNGVAYSTSGVWSERVRAARSRIASSWLLFNGSVIARRAHTAEEFARLAEAQSRIVGINLVVADSTTGFGVELTDAAGDIAPVAADGHLIRTNHYTAASEPFSGLTPTVEQYPNTYERFRFLDDRLSREARWSAGGLAGLLREAPVCRRPDNPLTPGSKTESASIADLAARTFSIVLDAPDLAAAPAA